MNRSFWQGKRVFVTGHTGFKGGWLSLWLADLGATVIGFSRDVPTEPSFFGTTRLAQRIATDGRGDLRDAAAVRAAMAVARPEVVMHLAAQSLVRPSYREPLETLASNVQGTAHVLDAVRFTPGVRAVVVVTSDKCYENLESPWGYRECDAMGGFDLYSASKGCAELVTAAYRRSFFNTNDYTRHGVAIASVRAGNAIGGGDWAADRLIPDAVRAFTTARPLIIRNPAAIRPWQHVLEPLSGYLLVAEKLCNDGPAFAEAFNFGPHTEESKTVAWVADYLVKRWPGAAWQHDAGEHPHEAHHLYLDCAKARVRLGWRPRWATGQSLDRTLDWYLAHGGGADMQALSLQQLREYANIDCHEH